MNKRGKQKGYFADKMQAVKPSVRFRTKQNMKACADGMAQQ